MNHYLKEHYRRMTYSLNEYSLELDGAKGRVFQNNKLVFLGFAYKAIKIYINRVPSQKHHFKSQLNMRQKVIFGEGPSKPEIPKPTKKLKGRP